MVFLYARVYDRYATHIHLCDTTHVQYVSLYIYTCGTLQSRVNIVQVDLHHTPVHMMETRLSNNEIAIGM